MFHRSGVALVLAAALGACSGPSTPALDEAQVQAFVRDYVAAFNAGDTTKYMSLISKAPGVTSAGQGELLRGWEAIRKSVDENIAAAAISKVTYATVAVQLLGNDTALATAPYVLTATVQRRAVQLQGAASIVLRREGGTLLVVHEHYSLKPQ